MTNTKLPIIPSINFHLWEPCNMRCKYCFATFQDVKTILPKGHLSREDALLVVKAIADFGFSKITFAGGEPTLCPWLGELISLAKSKGMTTMIVTNGTNLTEQFLKENQAYLDWITISIDSLIEESNINMGRAITGTKAITISKYYKIIQDIKAFGYGLKINTVVSQLNHMEDMSEFIAKASPIRWKIFQVLPIKNQNDTFISEFEIGLDAFNLFLFNHQALSKQIKIVPESNEQMTGTYMMIDPAGRFYDNTTSEYRYSLPILEVGVAKAQEQISADYAKFINREGLYNWENIKS